MAATPKTIIADESDFRLGGDIAFEYVLLLDVVSPTEGVFTVSTQDESWDFVRRGLASAEPWNRWSRIEVLKRCFQTVDEAVRIRFQSNHKANCEKEVLSAMS